MSEGGNARKAIGCKEKYCRISSVVTETNKPRTSIEYGGLVSCDTCGREWDYARSEGQKAVLTLLGTRRR